jgi:hypothetical protein
VAATLGFVPATPQWFLAPSPSGRLLLDLGRVDLDVRTPPARLAAYREAVAARSPLPAGARLRLRGTWGADSATVAGFDVWNGRIVATLRAPRHVDSLAADSIVAVAQRSEPDTLPPRTNACERVATDSMLARIRAVKDSMADVLAALPPPSLPRLRQVVVRRTSHVVGCFDGGRALVFVGLVAGDYEWVRERALLVSDSGRVRPLAIRDFRFRLHQALEALDADEDGFDDVAARAWTERAGGTVVLRLAGDRLERVSAGFAWER